MNERERPANWRPDMKKPRRNMGARKALQLFALDKAMDMKLKEMISVYVIPSTT